VYKQLRPESEHREGHRSADWALLDFGGFVVHVFSEQGRRFYDLERLWRNVPRYEIPDLPDAVVSSDQRRFRASGDHSLAAVPWRGFAILPPPLGASQFFAIHLMTRRPGKSLSISTARTRAN